MVLSADQSVARFFILLRAVEVLLFEILLVVVVVVLGEVEDVGAGVFRPVYFALFLGVHVLPQLGLHRPVHLLGRRLSPGVCGHGLLGDRGLPCLL